MLLLRVLLLQMLRLLQGPLQLPSSVVRVVMSEQLRVAACARKVLLNIFTSVRVQTEQRICGSRRELCRLRAVGAGSSAAAAAAAAIARKIRSRDIMSAVVGCAHGSSPNTSFPAKTGGIFGTLPWELWSSRVLSMGNSSTSDANASSTTECHQQ